MRDGRCACIVGVCVFVCVLECSRGTWLMLWTRLRDSVSVALLPPPRQPKTHAGTHTTSFSLSLILFFFRLLSQIIHDFFFYQTEIYLNCVLHVLLSIDYMLSNCCLLQCLPPLLSVSPETTSVTCQQRAQWQTIDCPFSECPLPLYPTI